MATIVSLCLLVTAIPSQAEARTIKHRSWAGYTSCHSKKWMRHHRHAKRCHHHRSRELRRRLAAVRYAKRHIGAPYRWGASGPYAFDCSGLVYAAYRSVGKHIPRTTHGQLRGMRGRHRSRRIGDLVFPGSGHVGIYIGHGRVIEAPHRGARVRAVSAHRFRYATRSPW